ncbi:MAG: hypothetical protein AAGD01_12780 [Acidobacteriota bacterium]
MSVWSLGADGIAAEEPPVKLQQIRSMESLERLMEWLWGKDVHSAAPRVLHVVAALPWQGELRALRIEERTPRSEFDALALSVARARADAIVTTGRILREEPRLRHEAVVAPRLAELLAGWRRRGGREAFPISLILTSGRGIDLDHPLFAAPGRPVLFTSHQGVDRLRQSGWRSGGLIQAVGVERPSLRQALDWLRSEAGAATVSVEAGPSTAAQLYTEPAAVEELMLSVYRGEVEEDLVGPPLPSWQVLTSSLPREISRRTVAEASGHWTLLRRSGS